MFNALIVNSIPKPDVYSAKLFDQFDLSAYQASLPSGVEDLDHDFDILRFWEDFSNDYSSCSEGAAM